MSALGENRIVTTFQDLREQGRTSLLPFLTAGYPDMDTTIDLLADFQRRGCRICELGIPFSDPVADGPTIQASYTEALSAGLTLETVFEHVRRFRDEGGELALLSMVSYSIVFRHGVEAYCRDAAAAGFDGLIVPDLPLEEAATFAPIAEAAGLCNVLLVAPTTPKDRRVDLAKHSSGFVYYMSVAGITGERDKLPPDTIQAVEELRGTMDTPICVGFGISRPEMVEEVCRVADGAIVGSAIVHRVTDAMGKGLSGPQLVESVGQFVGSLLEPLA